MIRRLWILLLSFHVDAAPEKKVFDGVNYHIVSAAATQVRVLWQDAADKNLESFPRANDFLTSLGEKPEVLMNGGIFEPGGIPSGMLIQNGRELRGINRRDGLGNFFLKPNGIFLISSRGAAVIASDEWPLAGVIVSQAVQSGPLLLRRGRIHPAFRAGSENRLHRNGIGVTKDGEVIMAMTDFRSPKFPNLHEFASLFAKLGCEDALFLDGDISQMRHGESLREPSGRFGSFIAVVKKSPE